MGPDSIKLILLILFLAASAFFSAAETALRAISKARVRSLVNDEVKGAKTLDKLFSEPARYLYAILVADNISNISAVALATSLAYKYLGDNALIIAIISMIVIILIFGEVLPKSLSKSKSEVFALRIATAIDLTSRLLMPFTAVLLAITRLIVRLIGGDPEESKPFVTEDDLRTMVEVGHEEGVIQSEERNIIDNVFEFKESQVKDVMTSRIDMVAVEAGISYDDLISIFKEEQYSRLPVYEGNNDNIIGVIYVKDLIFKGVDKDKFDIKDYMREPFFTFEYQKISRLFENLRSKRIALAIVLDEYGGTAGLATLEDLVEQIVGDLEDEYDTVDKQITIINSHEFITEGTVKIDFLNDEFNLNIDEEEYDTIGGYVFGAFGRIPQVGESIDSENKRFTVQAMDKNRIERVKIDIKPKITDKEEV